MYIIAGLGNPGKQYEGTRHNIGWQVIDELADKHGIRVLENKFKGLIGKGMICGEKVILVKPLTYMNLSGECIWMWDNSVFVKKEVPVDITGLRVLFRTWGMRILSE